MVVADVMLALNQAVQETLLQLVHLKAIMVVMDMKEDVILLVVEVEQEQ